MSLLLAGAVVGASTTALALVLVSLTIGIHRQEHAASLTHRPASLSAALARRILGLHTPGPPDPVPNRTDDNCPAKETTR
jgi:hypothetical protein